MKYKIVGFDFDTMVIDLESVDEPVEPPIEPPIDPPIDPPVTPGKRITGFTYQGVSRFNGKYGYCGIGAFAGEGCASDNSQGAYVVGFRTKEDSGWVPYRQPYCHIKRPVTIASAPSHVTEIPQWTLINSWPHFQDGIDNSIIWHPCPLESRVVFSMKNTYNVGIANPPSAWDTLPMTIAGNGWTHNRGSEYALPLNDELKAIHPAIASASWAQGGCIASGAATASFGPSLYLLHGTVATAMMYFPYHNYGDESLYLKPYKNLDIPGYEGTGYQGLNSNTSKCKACICGTNLVAIVKCGLGPGLKIGGDSVAAEMYEDRLFVFDLSDCVAVLNGQIEPWQVRHYLEIPIYVGDEPQDVDTQFGPSVSQPSDGDIVLPSITGVSDEDATKQRPWGIMYDSSNDELMIVRRGVDTTHAYEPPPVVYHFSIQRSQ